MAVRYPVSTVGGRDLVSDSQTSADQPVMLVTLGLLLLSRTAVSLDLLKCVNVNEILMFPDDSDECCEEGEWLILSKAGEYR